MDEIQAMYDAGARLFLEVGPRNVLSGLTRQILDAPDVDVIALDVTDRNGVVQLLHAIGQLAVAGIRPRVGMLFEGRNAETLDLSKLSAPAGRAPGWLVNGAGARPVNRPRVKEAPMPPAAPAAAAAAKSVPVQRVPAAAARFRTAALSPQAAPLPAIVSTPVPMGGHAGFISSAPVAAAADNVMMQYQMLMSQFLQTQTAIMTAFLNGQPMEGAVGTAAPVIASAVAPASLAVASVPPPLPVARAVVEIEQAVVATRVAEVAVHVPVVRDRDFIADLLRLVSERTGYPADMLDPDVSIEADLGIDSIKRVEILSAFQRSCTAAEQSSLRNVMDRLTSTKTLREMANVIAEAFAAHRAPAQEARESVTVREPAVATAAAAPPRDALADLIALVSDRTGYPADMLDPDVNIEADLGIDSIKRVEILSAFQRNCPAADQRALQAVMDQLTSRRTLRELAARITDALAAHAAPARETVTAPASVSATATGAAPPRDALADLIGLVSERTGYPADMLDPDVNIEADLGIDSIKRVEILSAFQRTCPAADQRALQAVMDQLTSRRTLRELAARITEALAGPVTVAAPVQLLLIRRRSRRQNGSKMFRA